MYPRRRSRLVRPLARGNQRGTGVRAGRPDTLRPGVHPVDRLRFRRHLRPGAMSKALLRSRLDRLRDAERSLHSPPADPTRQQYRRTERRFPLLPGQHLRRPAAFIVCIDRGQHDVPNRRPHGGNGVPARGYGRRGFAVPLQGRVYLRRWRLPAALQGRSGRGRTFVSGGGGYLRAFQPRSCGRRRVHAHLSEIGSFRAVEGSMRASQSDARGKKGEPPRIDYCARTSVISRF